MKEGDGHKSSRQVDTSTLSSRSNFTGVDLLSELERVERLSQVFRGGRNVDEHERLGVATERVLQQISELGLSIRDMLILVSEGGDDRSKRGERLVDIFRLRQTISRGARGGESLRSSQIDEIQESRNLSTRMDVFTSDTKLEDGMRARRSLIHVGRG